MAQEENKSNLSNIKSLFKQIKDKISNDTSNPEIIGKVNSQKVKPDLLPISSVFDEIQNESPLGKKISDYINNVNDTFLRDDRYSRYKSAMKHPEVDGALDIYASETGTQDSDGNILNVFCSSERVTKILNEMFKKISIEDKSFDIIRNFCGFGDEFYEIIYSKSGKSIHSINQIPRDIIGRKEINGILQNFYLRKNRKIKESEDSSYSFDYTYNTKNENDIIDPIRILHWKIPSTEYAPYGRSILESVITPLEELKLMEQSLLIARITRAPERRVYYVNVGGAQGEKGIALAREIISRLKKKSILDKLTNNVESNVDFFASSEDIAIPFRIGEEKSTIESLPQLNDPGQLTDLDFIRDRIFPGLGIPRTYLFDETFANTNANLSNKSVSFAKRIRRIQKYFLYPIYKLAYIELKLKGIKEKEFSDLLITMNNPSSIDEREKIDLEGLKWQLISTMKSLNAEKIFYNDYYIYRDVLGLGNEEILNLMIQNLAQEQQKNPFTMIPEEDRPKDYLVINQLSTGATPTEGGEGISDEDGDGVPDEAENLFGGKEGGEAPPEEAPPEGEEELAPETASLIYKNKNQKALLEASLEKAKNFKRKRQEKELKDIDKIKTMKKYTSPIYTEEQLSFGNEFDGIDSLFSGGKQML